MEGCEERRAAEMGEEDRREERRGEGGEGEERGGEDWSSKQGKMGSQPESLRGEPRPQERAGDRSVGAGKKRVVSAQLPAQVWLNGRKRGGEREQG